MNAYIMEGSMSPTYRVLQFRTGTYDHAWEPAKWIGSEWMDVPVHDGRKHDCSR